jgi:hypothetical protein
MEKDEAGATKPPQTFLERFSAGCEEACAESTAEKLAFLELILSK